MMPKPVIAGRKECTKCRQWKLLLEYNKGKATDGTRSQCRMCDRNYKISVRYGLTLEEVERLWKTERCEICERKFSEHGSGHNRHLCFDHDHSTGVFRGILCNACDGALGYFQDSPEAIRNALKYLQKESEIRRYTNRCGDCGAFHGTHYSGCVNDC